MSQRNMCLENTAEQGSKATRVFGYQHYHNQATLTESGELCHEALGAECHHYNTSALLLVPRLRINGDIPLLPLCAFMT